MWIHRQTSFIKPGLMDQAFAHAASQPVPKGMTRRILRPITGSESTTKLVIERGFGGDMIDAAYAAAMNPEPADEHLLKWITLNENRGTHELLSVVCELPAAGKPGDWVDRRVVVAPPGRRMEAVDLWKSVANVAVEGFSFRLLTPRTGVEAISLFVAEWTFGRLEEWDAALAAHLATPEVAPIIARWNEINPYRSTWELLRIIG
jgi:hypothetical protein